jgi:hypothetical protein
MRYKFFLFKKIKSISTDKSKNILWILLWASLNLENFSVLLKITMVILKILFNISNIFRKIKNPIFFKNLNLKFK